MNNITASIVRDIVQNNAILTEYLARGIINTAALARELLPLVKKKL